MNPPKMPIHIGDLLRDTGHLRALLIGAYLLLLMHHWSTGSLPDDDSQLSSIARLTPAEWRKAKPIIEKFFEPGWVHGRVQKDLASANESYQKRAKAGEKGGKAKAETKQSSSNATAGPEQPITFNQVPDTKEEKKERTRASALAAPWIEADRSRFWEEFPNKVGKADALKAFDKASHKTTPDVLFPALQAYAKKTDDRPFCNPSTWLNQERWLDRPAPSQGNGNNGRRTVHQAADDLIAKIHALDEPAPSGLCLGEGEGAVRLLPPR